jgi:DNA-binding GntR family transcriptional regulator
MNADEHRCIEFKLARNENALRQRFPARLRRARNWFLAVLYDASANPGTSAFICVHLWLTFLAFFFASLR